MADRQPGAGPRAQRPASGQALLGRLQDRAPTSTQVVGFLTLVISGGFLLLLTGLTLTGTVAGLVFFGPIILLTCPIWFPVAAVIFIAIAGFLSFCGFGVAVVAGATWLYRYFSGRHPMGSDRVDYARSRIADTASHMKDYAWEYGGYLHSRAKDAAPGA
ncbi:oleosin 1 [Cocos nucifera]|nr:oleosin 1 [Cocos nucifera]